MSVIASLVSYWSLDETSGLALDAHGANPLSNNNSVGAGTGIVSGDRVFTAASAQYFSHADNADLSTGDIDFSFNLWFKVASLVDAQILAKDDNSVREYGAYTDSGGNAYFFVFGPSSEFAQAASTYSTGVWVNLACGHSSVDNVIWIAVNAGTPVTAAHTPGVRDGAAVFALAARSDGALFLSGELDQVGFWKRDIRSDLTWLYNAGAGRSYAALVAEAGGGASTTDGKILIAPVGFA